MPHISFIYYQGIIYMKEKVFPYCLTLFEAPLADM